MANQQARRRRPATTPDAREKQLTALAIDCVEERMRTGKASAQEYVHFLRLASEREELEREKLRNENQLRLAQIEQMASQARIEELYKDALDAMRSYKGEAPQHDDF